MQKKDVITKLATTEASLKRWQTRLKRAATKVHQLDKQRLRLALLLVREQNQPGVVEVYPEFKMPTAKAKALEFDIPAGPIPAIVVENVKAGLAVKEDKRGIPAFLDRADPHVAEKLTAARKKAEAEERKKMPLTGKAALAKIRERK